MDEVLLVLVESGVAPLLQGWRREYGRGLLQEVAVQPGG